MGASASMLDLNLRGNFQKCLLHICLGFAFPIIPHTPLGWVVHHVFEPKLASACKIKVPDSKRQFSRICITYDAVYLGLTTSCGSHVIGGLEPHTSLPSKGWRFQKHLAQRSSIQNAFKNQPLAPFAVSPILTAGSLNLFFTISPQPIDLMGFSSPWAQFAQPWQSRGRKRSPSQGVAECGTAVDGTCY